MVANKSFDKPDDPMTDSELLDSIYRLIEQQTGILESVCCAMERMSKEKDGDPSVFDDIMSYKVEIVQLANDNTSLRGEIERLEVKRKGLSILLAEMGVTKSAAPRNTGDTDE